MSEHLKIMPFDIGEVLQSIQGHVKRAGSLRNLAKMWKVTPAYLSDILLGRRQPGPKVLRNMCLVARKKVSILYYWEPDEFPKESAANRRRAKAQYKKERDFEERNLTSPF